MFSEGISIQKGVNLGVWVLTVMIWTSKQWYVFHLCQSELIEGEPVYVFIAGVHIVFISVV